MSPCVDLHPRRALSQAQQRLALHESMRNTPTSAPRGRGRLHLADIVLADIVLAAIDDPGEERDIV